ncbi:dirigent protein 1-like [Nymphaea colorata]|uniref:Dirigent protein n=1 Tax=Nymphaea colorata TaxID=210225 RepID=A0A5K1F6Y8_9MAGN|nr:dirigent protein 1-like [Nymphaea colorata]VVW58370.1 unnamed protein product [Nymphaea colorata]
MAASFRGTKATVMAILPLLMMLSSSSFASEEEMGETNIVCYMHDLLTGKNVTAVPVTLAANSTGFGTIVAIDDAVTEGPDRRSAIVGRAQGIYIASALDSSDFHLVFSVVFTEGKHKGSTLEIQGADRYLQQKREVSVVSGTGEFRYARGYAVLETVELDPPLNAVIKFNLTIRYPVADS